MPLTNLRRSAGLAALALGALLIGACGDDDEEETSSKPTTMSITTADAGKNRFRMTVPRSIEGGLVTVNFRNDSKASHEAQLIKLDGGHTAEEALKVVEAERVAVPDWFRAAGGVGPTRPGQTGTATVKLAPGTYGVLDTETEGEAPAPSARGALAQFTVEGDNGADFKETSAKVEAKDKGAEDHEFVASGLKAGTNNVTFDNPSKEIHHVIAFPIRGNATLADVRKFLSTEGEPSGPPPLDFEKGAGTAVLDGKQKETTRLRLTRGRNILLCFLTDRDGKGDEHYKQGMLEEVEVQ